MNWFLIAMASTLVAIASIDIVLGKTRNQFIKAQASSGFGSFLQQISAFVTNIF